MTKANVSRKKYAVLTLIYLMFLAYSFLMYFNQGFWLYEEESTVYGLIQRIVIFTLIFAVTFFVIFWLERERLQKGISFTDALIDRRYIICGLYFVLFCALGLHGFSVNFWSEYVSSDLNLLTLLFGFDKGIQSDVWAVGIPQIINQIENGFPLFNTDMMTQGGNTVLSGLPALELTIIGQPHYWGCFFGSWVGLAWLFWFKKFALLLGGYEVIRFLTKGNRKLAMLGSAVITLSPLMNWWFGHTVTVVIIYGQWCVAAAVLYLESGENIKRKILFAGIGCISAIGFVLGWYPALQVPFGYLMIILVICACIYYRKQRGYLFKKADLLILGITVLVIAIVLGRFIWISRESVTELLSTAFPGRRVSTGGTYPQVYIFYYILQILFPFLTVYTGNVCEASSVMPFIPLVYIAGIIMLIWAVKNKKFKGNGMLIALLVYSAFLISWLFVQYSEIFAKVTMFSYVTESRCVWVIAITSVYIGMICLDKVIKNHIFTKVSALAVAAVSTAVLAFFVWKNADMSYFGSYAKYGLILIIIFLLCFAAFGFFYLAGFKKVTAAALLIVSAICAISVTPLEQGTGSLENSGLSELIHEIDAEDPDALWMAEGDCKYGNFVYAQGVKTFNATNQYMDSEKWTAIDPTGENEDIYNRYAQVEVTLTDGETYLELISDDIIGLYLNPDDLETLGVDYFVTANVLEENDAYSEYFVLAGVDEESGMRVYEVRG